MLIGGLEKLSLLDYPDRLSAIVFTYGCNFRCHFCYNPMLVRPELLTPEQRDRLFVSEDDLFAFLRDRQGKLEAVVISGGEPTMHHDLPEFIGKIKALGYLVKLDTNGTNPEMLGRALETGMVDYVAMDIKAPWDKYQEVVNVRVDCSNLEKSVKILANSKVPHEFRTTVGPQWHKQEDILAMARQLPEGSLWYLQKFDSGKDLVNEEFSQSSTYSWSELEELAAAARPLVNCQVRTYD